MVDTLHEFEQKTPIKASEMNENFNYLKDNISDVNEDFNKLKEELEAKIVTLNTQIETQLATFQENLNTTISGLPDYLPDYTKYVAKEENRDDKTNIVHQAECDGWILIKNSQSNKIHESQLYVGKTKDTMIMIFRNNSNVVSACSAIFPIKKGWYYMGKTGSYVYSRLSFGFIPITTMKDGE